MTMKARHLLSASTIIVGILLRGPEIGAQAVKYVDFGSNKNVRLSYTALQETAAAISMDLALEKGAQELRYYVGFDPAPAGRYATKGADRLYFEIFDSAVEPRRVLMDTLSAVSSDEVLSGVFPLPDKPTRGPTDTRSFALVVPGGGFAPAGRYTATVTASLWSGPFKSGVYKGMASLNLAVDVGEIIDIAVVPVSLPFDYAAKNLTMDFGFLEAGNSRAADMVARANTTYGVSLSSANGGRLRNADPSDASEIPYELRIDAAVLALAPGTAVPIAAGAPATTSEGRRYRMEARILPFDFPTEGEYTDILTITISKN